MKRKKDKSWWRETKEEKEEKENEKIRNWLGMWTAWSNWIVERSGETEMASGKKGEKFEKTKKEKCAWNIEEREVSSNCSSKCIMNNEPKDSRQHSTGDQKSISDEREMKNTAVSFNLSTLCLFSSFPLSLSPFPHFISIPHAQTALQHSSSCFAQPVSAFSSRLSRSLDFCQ